MRRCIALAETMRGRTAPNPIVGCVIIDGLGEVIAEGVHRGPGTPHAEIDALSKLPNGVPPGSTMYVNLEPCNHHGRTPPCAPVVRDAKFARVIIGMRDPFPGHGGGAEVIGQLDILEEAACRRANAAWITWATSKRPRFILKAAITLDGKIATVGGESKWITGPEARADVMRLRDQHDAVMVGMGTVIADDPKLTVRGIDGGRDPIRIVVAGERPLPEAAAVHGDRLRVVSGDLGEVAKQLASDGITSVLVEGGGALHASLLAAGLADELYLYVAPKIVGGPAKSWVGGEGVARLADAYRCEFDGDVVRLGDDLRLHATLHAIA